MSVGAERDNEAMIEVSKTEVAWAAGFFDGEGTTRLTRTRGYGSLGMSVSQVELAPLERFQRALFGLGRIRWDERGGRNGIHVWYLTNWRDVQACLGAMWPFLCEPKRAQARPALAHIMELTLTPPRNRADFDTHCPHGHLKSEYGRKTNTRGIWVCRECMRLAQLTAICVDCGTAVNRHSQRCRACNGKYVSAINSSDGGSCFRPDLV